MLMYTLEGISTSTKYTGMTKGSQPRAHEREDLESHNTSLPENLVNE